MLSSENSSEESVIIDQPEEKGEANLEILIKIRSELKSILEDISS